MYIFGVDIPLVELIVGIIVVSAIILLEITAILILITYHMKNSKRLENKIGQLSLVLMKLKDKELKELDKLQKLEEKEEGIIASLKRLKIMPTAAAPKKKVEIKITPKRKVQIKKGNRLLEAVDKVLMRWKR